MTTELKQAAQQAVDAFDAFGDADDFASLFELTQKMRALRAAIQQAEAQQPDTGEPVAVTSWKELERLQAGIGSIASIFPADTAGFHVQLYTRPAPSVPDEKPLPDLMMASYHEAIGWNACRAAMLAAK